MVFVYIKNKWVVKRYPLDSKEKKRFFPWCDDYVGVNNSTQSYQILALIGFISYKCYKKKKPKHQNPRKLPEFNRVLQWLNPTKFSVQD